MDTIRATWKAGRIVLDGPVDWPEGSRLRIEPELSQDEAIGVREEDWSNTPEAIDRWLKWYDSLEPLLFTPQEEADVAAWRQKAKEHSIAQTDQRLEGLFE